VAIKSKKLRSHMILVYEHHIQNSSDFNKELLNILTKAHMAHIHLCSNMRYVPSCERCIVSLCRNCLKLLWDGYGAKIYRSVNLWNLLIKFFYYYNYLLNY
jgi:hypothetical protein